MKVIALSGGSFAIVDNEDYDALSQYLWFECRKNGKKYAVRNPLLGKDNTHLRMHRMILKMKKGKICDHKNGNGLDNRKENLRICTNAENLFNRGPVKSNTSGFKGVHRTKKSDMWRAVIGVMGKNIQVGIFGSKTEAAKAYNKAARKYHGKFAYQNKIPRRKTTAKK